MSLEPVQSDTLRGESIRVRGIVQGVGFRPAVWRLARQYELRGQVLNDGRGVCIEAYGSPDQLNAFCAALERELPRLARIEHIQRTTMPASTQPVPSDFIIAASGGGPVETGVAADAATCEACRNELMDPGDRRFGYPFINCTDCGPRLSIVSGVPYDRVRTSMADFTMCPTCQAEYDSPADRRYHAQPNACPVCGPQVWFVPDDSVPESLGAEALARAQTVLREGGILAIKGLGGFHLACDAGNEEAVTRLRRRKRRYAKPFALMARDADVVSRYCRIDTSGLAWLRHAAAPIVLLPRRQECHLPEPVAPGQALLGFMLPYTPLHQLLLQPWDTPLVMTSGNLSDEPQCIENEDALQRLGSLADGFLLHDRDIVNRVDDSVVRPTGGQTLMLRRARGFAPTPLAAPDGFAPLPAILGVGAELKSTVTLLTVDQAVVSQHLGDLEELRAFEQYRHTIELYCKLFQRRPEVLAMDAHPGYRSTRFALQWAQREGLAVERVYHHHAHIASVLWEHGVPRHHPSVLGVALDGLGFGEQDALWGGEFLLSDYAGFERLAAFEAVPMPGGTRAIIEPWRNTLAQLLTHGLWDTAATRYGQLKIVQYLQARPLASLREIVKDARVSPPASSCGRLFDAVAAAVGLCMERAVYEGQAAVEFEASLTDAATAEDSYPFELDERATLPRLSSAPLWPRLLEDLAAGVPVEIIAARFHAGLARAIAETVLTLHARHPFHQVVLSGGCLQNAALQHQLRALLEAGGLTVWSHRALPANDGGVSLGQAAVAAARSSA